MAMVNSLAYSAPSSVVGEFAQHASWSPYDNNAGTTAAVAGAEYCIVAGSTRLATGFSILSREHSMLTQLSPNCVIASQGFDGDRKTLTKRLKVAAVMYKHNHKKDISCKAMSQYLMNTLYHKRGFPYYTFNILAGLDDDGTGAVYSYDAIGSFQKVGYSAQGSGKEFITSLLDAQLRAASPLVLPQKPSVTHISLEKAIDIVKDCFTVAAERDIYTGDSVDIWILTKDGITQENMSLRKD